MNNLIMNSGVLMQRRHCKATTTTYLSTLTVVYLSTGLTPMKKTTVLTFISLVRYTSHKPNPLFPVPYV